MTDKDPAPTEKVEEQAEDRIDLQFVGPMATLTKGKMKFEKGKVYSFIGDEKIAIAQDLLDNGKGRFREYVPREKRRTLSERRSLRITTGGRVKGITKVEASFDEAEQAEAQANKPKLPADGFKSKKDAIAFAAKHYGVELDQKLNLRALNRAVEDAHLAKYPAPTTDPDDEDDELDTGRGYDPNAGETAVPV